MKLKKHIIFVCLWVAVSFSMYGQALNFSITSSNLLVMNSQTAFIPSQLKNLNSTVLDVDIIRVENNLPLNWHSGLCAYICYFAVDDSVRIQIPPFDSVTFKMYFTHTGGSSSDTAHTKILFRNVSNSSNFFLKDYYATYNTSLLAIDEEPKFSFNIFPNPANNNIFIECKNEISEINIFDVTGKNVRRVTKDLSSNPKNINVSELSKGIYFVHVEATNGNSIRKIIVN